MDFINDIPLSVAQAAHNGTSFSPEKRAASERQEYSDTLISDLHNLEQYADTADKNLLLTSEFLRYRQGYRDRMIKYMQTRSRVVSVMIAGPARFPNARNQKWNNISDKRLQELLEYRRHTLEVIKRKLQPELAPIMSGDSDAVERLTAKIAAAEADQQRMKQANQIIRKARGNTSFAATELLLLGFSESEISKLFTPNYMGHIGFEGWQLSNNNANIKRMRDRLTVIAANKVTENTVVHNSNGIYIEDCAADNRIRIFFPGKPEAAVRSDLKSNGFRWTPSLNCWQAYRNYKAQQTAQKYA